MNQSTKRRPTHINCDACGTQVPNGPRGRSKRWCSAVDCDTVRVAWENARARHSKLKAPGGAIVTGKEVLHAVAAQDWKCARTGLGLVRTGTSPPAGVHHHPFAVSLDRIDASKGYIAGNVQVVAFQYNAAKGQLAQDEAEDIILAMADAITARRAAKTP